MKSVVSRVPALSPDKARQHFERRLAYETDCWDVHHAITNEKNDFVLLDVRSQESFDAGHVPTAIHLPHWKISDATLADYPDDTLFVVYCAGPHCNGASKGAIALAKLGRPVKEMIGGAIGWTDEGFELVALASEKRVTQ